MTQRNAFGALARHHGGMQQGQGAARPAGWRPETVTRIVYASRARIKAGIEEILTQIYHQLMIGPRGAPQVEASDDEVFISFLSAFLAHMVAADGVVDDREIEVAEREASERVGGFDQREFREFCRHTDQLAPLEKLTEWATKFLTPQGFEMLLDLLRKIAEADGEMHERERKILGSVRATYEEVAATQTTAGTAG